MRKEPENRLIGAVADNVGEMIANSEAILKVAPVISEDDFVIEVSGCIPAARIEVMSAILNAGQVRAHVVDGQRMFVIDKEREEVLMVYGNEIDLRWGELKHRCEKFVVTPDYLTLKNRTGASITVLHADREMFDKFQDAFFYVVKDKDGKDVKVLRARVTLNELYDDMSVNHRLLGEVVTLMAINAKWLKLEQIYEIVSVQRGKETAMSLDLRKDGNFYPIHAAFAK